MEIRGLIIDDLKLQSGTSASGRSWKKQEFVLETFEQYPRKVVFTLFGDKVDQLAPSFMNYMKDRVDVTVMFDLESRSFVGRDGVTRWSTEVRPWKIVESSSLQVTGYDGSSFAPQQPVPGFAPQQSAPSFAPQQLVPGFAPQQPAPGFAPQAPQPAVPQFPAAEPAAGGTDDLPF